MIKAIASLTVGISSPEQVFEYTHYTITQKDLLMGFSIEVIWYTFLLIGFVALYKPGKRLGRIFGASIAEDKVICALSIYFIGGLVLAFVFPKGLYEGGFREAFIRSAGEMSHAPFWRTVMIDIPSSVAFGGFIILSLWCCSQGSQTRRFIGAFLEFLGWVFIGWVGLVLGARGFLVRAFSVYWVYLRVRRRRRALIIVAILGLTFIVFGLSLVGELRTYPIVSKGRLDVDLLKERGQKLIKEISLPDLVVTNVIYALFRVAPIDGGVFARWVQETSSFAGATPIVGGLLAFIPRQFLPDRPAPGSVSPSSFDTPAWITGRIMGTPHLCRGTTPATNSFWLAGYPSVVIASFIGGGFVAFLVGVGQPSLFSGLLVISFVCLAIGSPFLLLDLPSLLMLFTRYLLPFGTVLVVWRGIRSGLFAKTIVPRILSKTK
ncbi:MAG TPA: hypothetical protein ENF45_02300 [Bacteroidetes bacterium]|nr:hypothetical protein [Bacteroidota bacterium]